MSRVKGTNPTAKRTQQSQKSNRYRYPTPHYPKAECSCETFRKVKWNKANRLPLPDMEKLEHCQTRNNNLLNFAETISLRDAQNRAPRQFKARPQAGS